MNKLLLFLILLFISVSLEAYAKRVILASFTTEERADTMMQQLPTLRPSLYSLAKKHNFQIKLKKSGEYYIVIAEVFKDREVLNDALKQIRKSFKGAYVSTYKYPKKEALRPQVEVVAIKKEPLKPIVKEVEVETSKNINETKYVLPKKEHVEASPKEVSENIVATQKFEIFLEKPLGIFKKYFEWSYVITIVLSLIIVRYYIKFKRIYDEY